MDSVPALPGAEIRRLRLQKRMTLKELAESAGTSASALHRYESGWDGFELRTLRRLAAALDARLLMTLETTTARPATPTTDDALAALLRPLFWDVDLTAAHIEENPEWVLRRVLQIGDWDAVRAVRLRYGDDAVRAAAEHRSMDARTRQFWRVVLSRDGRPA